MNFRVLVTVLALLATRRVAAQDLELPKLDPKKFTICTITINSDNEKKVFGSQVKKDPKNFNPIVELTEFGNDEDWFSKACSSGVRCDQLVVSGHFAGSFFGDSPKRLSIEELERMGCSHACDGVLSDPYEVFLFGCNTLAEKEKDRRTPAEYLSVLLQDGIPRDEANRIVAARYGEMGDSFRSSMKRAFAGQRKQLYGFGSVGPSGENVERMLKNYMSSSSLKQRLERLEVDRIKSKTSFFNENLANALRSTSFNQCLAGFEAADEKAALICGMMDPDRSIEERMGLVKQVLSRKDFLSFVPRINDFFARLNESDSNHARNIMAKPQYTSAMRDRIYSLIESTTDLNMLNEWTNFAENVGIIENQKKRQIWNRRINDKIMGSLLQSDVDMICSMANRIRKTIDLSWQDIERQELSGMKLDAVECLADRRAPLSFQYKVLEELKTKPSPRSKAYSALSRMIEDNKELQLAVLDLAKSSPHVLKLLKWKRGSGTSNILAHGVASKLVDMAIASEKPLDRLDLLEVIRQSSIPRYKLELSLSEQRKLFTLLEDQAPAVRLEAIRTYLKMAPSDKDIQFGLLKALDDKFISNDFKRTVLRQMSAFLLNEPELQEKFDQLSKLVNNTVDTNSFEK